MANPQHATANPEQLVHREKLSKRYHDEDKHPWLAIGAGLVVAIGLLVWVAFF